MTLLGVFRFGFRGWGPGAFLEQPLALFDRQADAEEHCQLLMTQAHECLNPFDNPEWYDIADIASEGWVAVSDACESLGLELPIEGFEYSVYYDHKWKQIDYAT
jgi:hypothetical protein